MDQRRSTWALVVLAVAKRLPLRVLVWLPILYVLAVLVTGWLVQRRLAALRAQGAPVSMAGLRGPRIRDSDNGAVVYAPSSRASRPRPASRIAALPTPT